MKVIFGTWNRVLRGCSKNPKMPPRFERLRELGCQRDKVGNRPCFASFAPTHASQRTADRVLAVARQRFVLTLFCRLLIMGVWRGGDRGGRRWRAALDQCLVKPCRVGCVGLLTDHAL